MLFKRHSRENKPRGRVPTTRGIDDCFIFLLSFFENPLRLTGCSPVLCTVAARN